MKSLLTTSDYACAHDCYKLLCTAQRMDHQLLCQLPWQLVTPPCSVVNVMKDKCQCSHYHKPVNRLLHTAFDFI